MLFIVLRKTVLSVEEISKSTFLCGQVCLKHFVEVDKVCEFDPVAPGIDRLDGSVFFGTIIN